MGFSEKIRGLFIIYMIKNYRLSRHIGLTNIFIILLYVSMDDHMAE